MRAHHSIIWRAYWVNEVIMHAVFYINMRAITRACRNSEGALFRERVSDIKIGREENHEISAQTLFLAHKIIMKLIKLSILCKDKEITEIFVCFVVPVIAVI